MDSVLTAVAVGVAGLLSAAWGLISPWLQERGLRQERRRLAAIVELESVDDPGLLKYVMSALRGDDPAMVGGDDADDDPDDDAADGDRLPARPVDPAERFAPLLIEYYAYGLAQAKRHSAASLTMSSLGGLLILAGVGVLIYDAQVGRDIAAPSVATAAGVLTNAIAALFHRQANQALKHMQEQTQTLRDDMRQEREGRLAVDQLNQIHDPALRDRLRAALVLRLSGASLKGLRPTPARRAGPNLGLPASAPMDPGYPTAGGWDFSGADPGRANLGGANLGGANLGGANLGGANLGGANLNSTDLDGRASGVPASGVPASVESGRAGGGGDPEPDLPPAVPLRSRRGRKPGRISPPRSPNAADPGTP